MGCHSTPWFQVVPLWGWWNDKIFSPLQIYKISVYFPFSPISYFSYVVHPFFCVRVWELHCNNVVQLLTTSNPVVSPLEEDQFLSLASLLLIVVYSRLVIYKNFRFHNLNFFFKLILKLCIYFKICNLECISDLKMDSKMHGSKNIF